MARYLKIARLLPALMIALFGCSGDETTTPTTPDTTAPTVVSTSPADGTTDVLPTTSISATFSEAMDKWSFNSVTFVVGGGISGAYQYIDSSRTAVFTPSVNLAYNQLYTVTLDTAIKDLAGNQMDSQYVWSFTIVAPPPGVIMPLAVGNQWEFIKATYDTNFVDSVISEVLDTISIARDSLIQSETWFVGKSGKMYTNRTSGLWSRSAGGEAYLFLKYPAAVSDFYPANPDLGETITVQSTNAFLGVPHGNHYCYFYLSTVSDPSFRYRYYYEPDLGPVVHEKRTASSKLVERMSLKSLRLF